MTFFNPVIERRTKLRRQKKIFSKQQGMCFVWLSRGFTHTVRNVSYVHGELCLLRNPTVDDQTVLSKVTKSNPSTELSKKNPADMI